MPSRPCRVEISTRAFENNFRFLHTLAPPQSELLAIVKANAYGHSLALCAPAAVRAGARWLGVTSVEEAVTARELCPHVRILVMGGVFDGQHAATIEHHLTAVAWEPYQLDELEAAARKKIGHPKRKKATKPPVQDLSWRPICGVLPRVLPQSCAACAARQRLAITAARRARLSGGQCSDER